MRVTIPITITDAKLISSPVAEPGTGEAEYDSGTSYALGDVVISSTYHRKYESLQASNLGKPLPVWPLTETDWWMDIGPTNKWAMFDLARNTQTEYASNSLAVTVAPGERINTVGVLGMDADHIAITATSVFGGGAVYSHEEELIIREVLDHYMYAFEPFSRQTSAVVFDIPPFSDIQITITLTNYDSRPIKVGSVITGTYAYIGDTQYEARSNALNFSTIDRDVFGNATLVPRRSLPETKQTLTLAKHRVKHVYKVRTQLNAVPALYTALDDASDGFFEALMILGVYKQFEINVDHPTKATVTLELEEI